MPLTTLPLGQTVTLHQRTVTSQDARGNDVYSDNAIQVTGCAVTYGASTENVEGTDTVVSDATVYMPDGSDPTAYDRMTLPDGNTYEIQGKPVQQKSPFSGTTSYIEVHGRLVTGSTV